MKLSPAVEQLVNELETLASFSPADPPGVTRIVYSEADMSARAWFIDQCNDARLSVRVDAVGNTFARWQGSSPELPPVGTGSHFDAIPHSGKFDGTVGVLGGLEAIRTLQRAGYKPVRSIELLLFTSEEPTRFGIGCLGSRLLSGELTAAADTALQDANGSSLQEVRTSAGFSGTLDSVRMPGGYYSAFLELHIEQGPLLEQRGISIGAVTAIAAPSSLRVIIEGQGGHAGGVLMPDRRDAFMAAAEIALALETLARSTGSIDTVATCGVCNVFPGLVNGIPSRVTLELDVRDIDGARRDTLLKDFHNEAAEIAARRGVHIRFEPINQDAPAPCDPGLVDAVVRASEKYGISCQRMISRAYHDSLFMTRICPVGMIFIPCRDGVSHRPDEYTWPEALEHGVTILAAMLAGQSAA